MSLFLRLLFRRCLCCCCCCCCCCRWLLLEPTTQTLRAGCGHVPQSRRKAWDELQSFILMMRRLCALERCGVEDTGFPTTGTATVTARPRELLLLVLRPRLPQLTAPAVSCARSRLWAQAHKQSRFSVECYRLLPGTPGHLSNIARSFGSESAATTNTAPSSMLRTQTTPSRPALSSTGPQCSKARISFAWAALRLLAAGLDIIRTFEE